MSDEGIQQLKLISAGVRALLTSAELQADLRGRAARIAVVAGMMGGEFRYDVQAGAKRARAIVWTEDTEAMVAEATHRALTNAIGAGRG